MGILEERVVLDVLDDLRQTKEYSLNVSGNYIYQKSVKIVWSFTEVFDDVEGTLLWTLRNAKEDLISP